MHTSFDSRMRHSAFLEAYQGTQPRRTEANREHARIDAHQSAERAMQGLDEWMHDTAMFALSDGRRRGFPDTITEEVAQRVLSAIGAAILEATR